MHVRAWFSDTFPSLAGKICADLLGEVTWTDVRDARLGIPEIEHSHVLLICILGFNYLYLFVWFRVCVVVVSSLRVARVVFCVSRSSGVRWVRVWCGRLWKKRIGSRHGAVL